MNILIIYYNTDRKLRNTVVEHLNSFKNYSDETCCYLNVAFGIPSYILSINFDLIVYHYTFLALKWSKPEWLVNEKYSILRDLSGYKIAIPQDEYVNTIYLNRFFKEFGVKSVFTCLPESDWQLVYPSNESGLENYTRVLPGYIDEINRDYLMKSKISHSQRSTDIFYRARKLPYWLGNHSSLKWKVAEEFKRATSGKKLNVDVSTRDKDALFGYRWYDHLMDSRVMPGCEGGAGLFDPDGSVRSSVENYMKIHSDAQFEEVEKNCFNGLDNSLNLFTIGPRNLEACITGTCQALVEGEYNGILSPGEHYIEIVNDFSNIDEVIKQIEDKDHCERIAEKAFKDIALNQKYSYRHFVSLIIEHVNNKAGLSVAGISDEDKSMFKKLSSREKFPVFYSPYKYLINSYMGQFLIRIFRKFVKRNQNRTK